MISGVNLLGLVELEPALLVLVVVSIGSGRNLLRGGGGLSLSFSFCCGDDGASLGAAGLAVEVEEVEVDGT